MSAIPPPTMTVEEFERYAAEHGRCELINGEVHPMSPTGNHRGLVTGNLHGFLWSHVRDHKLGRVFAAETGFRGRETATVRAPDIAFIQSVRVPEPMPASFGTVIPDLIAETTSPSDRASDVSKKVRWWLDEGARLVWVVEPATRAVTAYLPDGSARVYGEAETLTAGDVVPGFEVLVAEIFE